MILGLGEVRDEADVADVFRAVVGCLGSAVWSVLDIMVTCCNGILSGVAGGHYFVERVVPLTETGLLGTNVAGTLLDEHMRLCLSSLSQVSGPVLAPFSPVNRGCRSSLVHKVVRTLATLDHKIGCCMAINGGPTPHNHGIIVRTSLRRIRIKG